MKSLTNVLIAITLFVGFCNVSYAELQSVVSFLEKGGSYEPALWRKFAENENNSAPVISDFSYAGYKQASERIPTDHSHLTQYDLVDDYGAIPNDGQSDT